MKKGLLGLMAVLVMAVCAGFAACGSDDDDESGLVGTWVHSETYTSSGVTYLQSETVTFKSNGTGVAIVSSKAVSGSSSSNYDYADTSDFTWKTSGDKLYITIKRKSSYSGDSTETTVATYVISGKTLAITWEIGSSSSGSSSSRYTTIYEKQ